MGSYNHPVDLEGEAYLSNGLTTGLDTHNEPIAICGMAIRLPGNISSPDEFWEFLLDGRDARGAIPSSRYNSSVFFDSLGRPGTASVGYGYFLDSSTANPEAFDSSAFSMNRAEVSDLDPVQRQLLEIVRECLESAGESSRGQDIGVFIGSFGEDWQDLSAKDTQAHGPHRVTGSADFMLANRVSYEYDLRGPSVTYRTACSASLVALHAAVQALRSGDCSGAVVAAANLILSPSLTIGLSEVGALAPDASCKTLDASADGYARGEAVNAVYLRRLRDAIADGDPVRAVIRGTASNSDGSGSSSSSSLMNPNGLAHERLIRSAYRNARLDPADTAFFELHGTGTVVGDVTETGAVAKVFGDQGIHIGSVKPNVGHGEGASGLTSLIKAVLALEHKVIPPNIKFNNPNPKIPFKEAKLIVPTKPTQWPAGRLERVSVNSFGLGGTNAHVILDSAASSLSAHLRRDMDTNHKSGLNWHLLLNSAYHPDSLTKYHANLQKYIGTKNPNLHDVAYTLACRREHLPHRSFSVLRNVDDQLTTSQPVQAYEGPKLVLVFTGQGAQHPEMGKSLAEMYSSFDTDLRHFDKVLSSLADPPKWSIRDAILNPSPSSMVGVMSQPLTIAVQIGLVNLLYSWGVVPDAIIGHSSGEIAAAYASGALSMEDAIKLSYRRGRSLPSGSRGGMAVVGLGKPEVLPYLRSGVTIGCDNSPENVTLSGDKEVLEAVIAQIQGDKPQAFLRRLQVDMAYHSSHMEEISDVYAQSFSDIKCGAPRIPMYSTTRGKKLDANEVLDVSYWRANLVQPVLFNQAVRAVLEDTTMGSGHKVFLEVGPHSALRGTLRQCFKYAAGSAAKASSYVPTLVRQEPSDKCLLSALGNLHCLGVSVNLNSIFSKGSVVVDLPRYQWRSERITSHGNNHQNRRMGDAWRHRRFPRHELLGTQVLENIELEPAWRNLLRLKDISWINDHKVGSDIIFPGAGYIAMAGEAVQQAMYNKGNRDNSSPGVENIFNGYNVRYVTIAAALILRESTTVEIMTQLRPVRLTESEVSASWYDFSVSSVQNGTWTRHCHGQVQASTQSSPIDTTMSIDNHGLETQQSLVKPFPRQVSVKRWYKALERSGLRYGPAFTKLTQVSAAVDRPSAVAIIAATSREGGNTPYAVHPTILDGVFQAFSVAAARGKPAYVAGLFVPTYIQELSIQNSSQSSSDLSLRVDVDDDGSLSPTLAHTRDSTVGSVVGLQSTGEGGDMVSNIVVQGRGLKMSRLSNGEEGVAETADKISNASMKWMPSLEFLGLEAKKNLFSTTYDISSVLKSLEEMVLLSMCRHRETISCMKGASPHLEKFRRWILETLEGLETFQHPVWPNLQLEKTSPEIIDESIYNAKMKIFQQTIREDDPSSTGAGAIDAVARIAQYLPDIIEGKSMVLELLSADDALSRFYQVAELGEYGSFLDLLSHERPTCNILEVGAGTGSTTARVLSHLYSKGGNRMFSNYTFTDISEGFLSLAKGKFQHQYPAVTYQLFDITQDPEGQGIKTGFYDLVIANNVVHATPSLQATLTNIRKVLRPDGYLLLQEMCTDAFTTSFVMGGLEGWWLGADDGVDGYRDSRPYIKPEQWKVELQASGFGEIEVSFLDHQGLSNPLASINALMIARPAGAPVPRHLINGVSGLANSRRVTVLIGSSTQSTLGSLTTIESCFAAQGIAVDFCRFDNGELPVAHQDIVSLLDLDGPFLLSMSPDQFQNLRDIFTKTINPREQRVLWVTRLSQSLGLNCPSNPDYAPILGMARNLRFELGIDFSTLDANDLTDIKVLENVAGFYAKYRGYTSQQLDPSDKIAAVEVTQVLDYEFSLINGKIYIGRYSWSSIHKQAESFISEASTITPKKLQIAQKGNLQTLHWQATGASLLKADEVRIEVVAMGINFRDVMLAMRLISIPGANGLGLEAAGKVVEVGPDVSSLVPGDRVVVLRPGCFTTQVVATEKQCVPIPDELSLEDAAGMWIVFCTSVVALMDIGRIRQGQSVLIHSACGGVGLSAIQICQALGVEVYATVGNEAKAEYLRNQFQIPADHIFDSRSPTFGKKLMLKTQGRGVDLVLNSLAGELLHVSWDCVADFGVMVELGKRDIQQRAKLDMSNFSRNRGYYGVDYEQIIVDRPDFHSSVMHRVLELYRQGKISALPIKTFATTKAEQCFRSLQKGEHIGKIVMTVPEELATTTTEISPHMPTPSIMFDPGAAYLLVGGLGGIGRSVAVWMAEHGAKKLVFLSRSKGSIEAQIAHRSFFDELEALKCSYTIVKGDVAVLEDVNKAIAPVDETIRGVLHMAAELNDNNFGSMTYGQWQSTLSSKITGTLNLHNAFSSSQRSLDFFVLFSSQSAVHGWYGQTNYAAANAFLSAFVEHRRRQGHAASVLDLGPVEDIGLIQDQVGRDAGIRSTFKYLLPERELLDAVGVATTTSRYPIVRKEMSQDFVELTIGSYHITPGLRPSLPSSTSDTSISVNTNYPWKGDARFLVYQNLEADLLLSNSVSKSSDNLTSSSATAADQALSTLLIACAQDPTAILHSTPAQAILVPSHSSPPREEAQLPETIVARAIVAKVCTFLDLPEDQLDVILGRMASASDSPAVTLSSLGVDSLIAMELRGWWRQRLGLEISVLEILEHSEKTVAGQLARTVLEGLKQRFPRCND